MSHISAKLLLPFLCIVTSKSFAQSDLNSCKVLMETISSQYKGNCKKGLADGEGEASGIDKYIGTFKMGFPNGKGTYYFKNHNFFVGNFQEGVKEGKGEMHYVRNGLA